MELATASGSFTNPNGLQVGGGYLTNNEFSDAVIGEVVIYNRILTPTERASVETYLATKWGVTLGG